MNESLIRLSVQMLYMYYAVNVLIKLVWLINTWGHSLIFEFSVRKSERRS